MEPLSRLAQIRRATAAYEALSRKEPELPAADSPLPALLAYRETVRLVRDLQGTIESTAQQLSTDRERLKIEQTNSRDAQAISRGLNERIEVLQQEKPKERERSPPQLAKQTIQQQQKKQIDFSQRKAELEEALNEFIDDHLAPMIAAEDSGGPVVGDQVDVSDAVLEAGFTAHGKERKPKMSTGESSSRRQQRMDEFVRRQDNSENTGPRNRREATAEETRTLLNELLEAGQSSSYIQLNHDSAASRFLVKAKLAQFHPKDSHRLRLIDFTRDITE